MARIEGLNRFNQQLNNLQNLMPAVTQSVRQETLRVQRNAVLLCPVNHGELRQSIKTKTEATENKVTGTVYTNKKYAAYVEFGTGPVGEADHDGISPVVNPTYVQSGWWFPGKDIPVQDAEKYHWPKSVSKEGEVMYFTQGQPAQPFMYPALKRSEPIITRNIARAIRTGMAESAR